MHESDPHERRRWLAWAASGLVVLNTPGLAGCGGGGEDSGATPAPPSPPPPAPAPPSPPTGADPGAAAAAAAQAALAAINALAARTPGFDATAAAAELARSGAFAQTGADTTTQTAWGRTAAGRWLLVPAPGRSASGGAATPVAGHARPTATTAPDADAATGRKTALASGTDLPRLLVARQMRLLDMFGPIVRMEVPHLVSEAVDARTLPNLRAIAKARGLELVPTTPDAAFEFAQETTVEGLRSISGDGVFFVNSFGGGVTDAPGGGSLSAIASTTRAFVRAADGSAVADPAHEADLAAGRLVQMVVPDLRSATTQYRDVLGITPDFARFHDWQFAPNSLAWLNVIGGGVVGPWQGMLAARGARTLVGWSQAVTAGQILAFAEDFFHLTLATDRFDGPLAGALRRRPRLRNYGNGETLEFLLGLGLASSSELAYFQQAGPENFVNVLTPTLDYVLVNEDEETCELVGQFGADSEGSLLRATALNTFSEPLMDRATDPTVQFGDRQRIQTWEGDFVRAELRRDVLGGYLQLRNGGRWSNVVPLTYWEMPISVRATITGGLLLDVTLELRLRGDIRGYRLRPDQPPLEQRRSAILLRMLGTQAQWSASGAIEQTVGDTTTRIEWSGSGLFATGTGATDGSSVGFSGNIDFAARSMRSLLSVGGPGLRERTVVTREGRVQRDETVTKPVGVGFPLTSLDGLELLFEDDWSLRAGSARDQETVSLLGTRTREIVVSWPGAGARFAPDDEVGGR